jgi:hypothetical protein
MHAASKGIDLLFPALKEKKYYEQSGSKKVELV